MNKSEALKLAESHIAAESAQAGVELRVLEDRTLEKTFGWIFFYDTQDFIRTGDDLTRAVGNAPIIVDKVSGKLEVTGTARPIEYYVSLYEQFGTCHPER